ncbi:MAG TPA: hypothetical protein VFU02_17815 [Polyangiaceae bacterium]|nr:hypothetical protein [Polyangiaceae bacterium]
MLALALGSLRALVLWRAQSKVDVVNAVVLGTLSAGRPEDLTRVLSGSGSGLYLEVVRAIVEPLEKLRQEHGPELRRRLELDMQRALVLAGRHSRRLGWLDPICMVLCALAAVATVVSRTPSSVTSLGLFAATLLVWSNQRGYRALVREQVAGAAALVDALVLGIEQIRSRTGRDL